MGPFRETKNKITGVYAQSEQYYAIVEGSCSYKWYQSHTLT